MTVASFRFDPPEVPVTPALRWVLARAYAAGDTALVETEGGAAVALAQRFALAARIASRAAAGAARRRARSGRRRRSSSGSAPWPSRRRCASARRSRRSTRRPPTCGFPTRRSRGRRWCSGGFAPDGGRPSSDLDLLVPEAKLDALQKELLRQGFDVAGEAYEHQAPGAASPGRRDGRAASRAARRPPRAQAVGDLRDARRRRPPRTAAVVDELPAARRPAPAAARAADRARARACDRAARSRAGGLSGLSLPRRPGGPRLPRQRRAGDAGGDRPLDRARSELRRGRSGARPRDRAGGGDGAAASRSRRRRRSRARRLLDHFHAGVTDPDYAMALKTRLLEQPLSDKPQAVAKAELLAKTLAPRAAERGRRSDAGRVLARLPRAPRRPAVRAPAPLARRPRRRQAAGREIGHRRNGHCRVLTIIGKNRAVLDADCPSRPAGRGVTESRGGAFIGDGREAAPVPGWHRSWIRCP